MEQSLLKTYTPGEIADEIADEVGEDVYMIKANMNNVEEMIKTFIRDHESKLKYNEKAVTRAIVFYQTYYDVRTEVINGHWTAIALRGHDAYFFDSLGIFPDDELNRLNPNTIRLNCSHGRRNIGNMLYGLSLRGYRIHYNPKVFQEDKPSINTCGRYVILFLRDAVRYRDPYKYIDDALSPHKKESERYYDNAIIRYDNNK